MTTGLAGGLIKPYKGIRPAALTRSESPPTASLFTGSRLSGTYECLFLPTARSGLLFVPRYRLTRKRVK